MEDLLVAGVVVEYLAIFNPVPLVCSQGLLDLTSGFSRNWLLIFPVFRPNYMFVTLLVRNMYY